MFRCGGQQLASSSSSASASYTSYTSQLHEESSSSSASAAATWSILLRHVLVFGLSILATLIALVILRAFLQILCDVCLLNQGGRIRRSIINFCCGCRHRRSSQQQQEHQDQEQIGNTNSHGNNDNADSTTRSDLDIENQRQCTHRFLKQLLPCRILTKDDLEKWAAADIQDFTMSSSSDDSSSACGSRDGVGSRDGADRKNETVFEETAGGNHSRNVQVDSSCDKDESCKEQQIKEEGVAASKNDDNVNISSGVISKDTDNNKNNIQHDHDHDDRKSNGTYNNGILCSICLAELTPGDEIVQAHPCQHVFHSDCILQWLTTCTTTYSSSVGRPSSSSSTPSLSYWNLVRDANAGGRELLMAISRTDCPNCRTEIVSPTALQHAIDHTI
jgi:RING-like zinc finger